MRGSKDICCFNAIVSLVGSSFRPSAFSLKQPLLRVPIKLGGFVEPHLLPSVNHYGDKKEGGTDTTQSSGLQRTISLRGSCNSVRSTVSFLLGATQGPIQRVNINSTGTSTTLNTESYFASEPPFLQSWWAAAARGTS